MSKKKKIWHPGTVEEPAAAYETILTGGGVEGLIARVKEGLRFDVFNRLRQVLDFTEVDMAEVLSIPSTTLSRRKKEERLTSDESERLLRVARLYDLAARTFDDEDEARSWLKTPRDVFGGETPLQRASTEIGARQVEDVLGRIEHGVYS